MALGVDVRIHADGDASGPPQALGDRLNPRQLACRFDVDGLQPERHGAFELAARFADAGKHDVLRLESDAPRQINFPDRIRVGGAAEGLEERSNRERRVGFQRVVQRMRIPVKRVVDFPESCADVGGAVDVERRSDPIGNG